MKKIKASIDSIPIDLYVPETLEEYSNGLRTFKSNIPLDSGMLFNYKSSPNILVMENSGVNEDITLLYFLHLQSSGIVFEVANMKKNDRTAVASKYVYSYVLELRSDFCKTYNIKNGSVLKLKGNL